jgi:CheY-like chemotaxis protein
MSDRIRVLYVDDSHLALKLHSEALVDHGFEVVTATTPKDGLDRLADGGVDCVLSDLEMPGTDGLEFLSTIRVEHPLLPFILFTGNESEQTVTDAFDRGATDFVPKSFCAISEELLCRRIEQAIA